MSPTKKKARKQEFGSSVTTQGEFDQHGSSPPNTFDGKVEREVEASQLKSRQLDFLKDWPLGM